MFKTLKLTGVVALLVVVSMLVTRYISQGHSTPEVPFEELTPEEMRVRIISERDHAIRQAEENGEYRCCIEPPCTMCYMEANPWNNFIAGTCACDDLIAKGKEPCPQCLNGMCENEPENAYCDLSGSGHPT